VIHLMNNGSNSMNVVLIGVGRIGLLHLNNLLDPARGLNLKLVAVVDQSLEAINAAKVIANNYSSILPEFSKDWSKFCKHPEVDAAIICTQSFTHYEIARSFLKAGKHVFCEKPLAEKLDEIVELGQLAAEKNLVCQPGFNRRFDEQFKTVKRLMDQENDSKIFTVIINSRDPEPPPLNYPRSAGGLYVDSAIHDFDLIRFLVGKDIDLVSSLGSCLVDEAAKGARDLDVAATILRFSSGTIGIINNCRFSSSGYDQRLEVHLADKTISVANIKENAVSISARDGLHCSKNIWFFEERYMASYVNELKSFANAMATGKSEVDAYDAYCSLLLASVAIKSNEKESTILVGDFVKDLANAAKWKAPI
jgi:myo-inositol 2-dehydrogenase/D-chiro-inositol 1-dehydrogenase